MAISHPFQDATLLISARSPFARRVRLAFLENGIRFEEKVYDVFKPLPELIEANPLGRVPALRLKGGQVLIDSNLILAGLYEAFDAAGGSPLYPAGEDRFALWQWSAIAVGLAEKTVEYFLETLRPESNRDAELLAEVPVVLKRVLERFETVIRGRGAILNSGFSQADIDMVTALTYLSLRHGEGWKRDFPETARYVAALESRKAFELTRPPA